MNNSEKYMKLEDEYTLQTYARFPIVIEKGEGVYVTDADGKRYLDFAAGIAVYALGYGNREFNEALKKQIDLCIHTSNLYYNEPASLAAKAFCEVSGMDRVFFTNSGTEAIEGAVKSALKYAFSGDKKDDHEIIAFDHSFHGRSLGALSVTGNPHYREGYTPWEGRVKFAVYNDLESVKALVNDRTCAVIMETVQGEGGIHPADPDFIKGVRKLCDEKGLLLILDEIQCGLGRTGSMFAFEDYGVRPDILTSAKALGCGIPVGAFAMTQKVADRSLKVGDHGSTYGGNPLACAAVCEVLNLFEKTDIVSHVKSLTPVLEEALDGIAKKYPGRIKERRGKGFMQALEFTAPVADVIKKAQQEGLLIISAGANVLRLLPPLVIEKEHINEMKNILDKVISAD
ncbi:MAG: aspartate aminotransferase family protein [Lachnospiraceae bacterium]|nr:aspartate aminotransferase family protein [Lachnospiraceae bacterium]